MTNEQRGETVDKEIFEVLQPSRRRPFTATATSTTPDHHCKTMSSDMDIPEEMMEAKAQLEAETGKKYKYRKPKRDLPSVGHMLAHGAPESEGKPDSWSQIIGYPVALAIIFGISLLIFHHAPHSKSVGRKHFEINAAKKHKIKLPPIVQAAEEAKPLRYPDVDLYDLPAPGEKEVEPLAPLDVAQEVQDDEEVKPIEPEL